VPYPEVMVRPMREEVTRLGAKELLTEQDVDRFMASASGTVLILVNSVCGCAAGMARPGLALALTHSIVPDQLATVFAGQDLEATARMRSYFDGHPATSPQFALFKDRKLVRLIHRHEIEGRSAADLAGDLITAFETFCAPVK